MRTGLALLLAVWFVIGALAGLQRHYYSGSDAKLCQGWDHCSHGPRGSSQLRRGEPKNRGLFSATTKQVIEQPR